jgi:hypothetical protein
MKKHDKPIPHTTTGKGKTYNPTEKGAGMTAKGRAEYNAKNNSNLKPPAPNPKTKADAGRKASFLCKNGGSSQKRQRPSGKGKGIPQKLELLKEIYHVKLNCNWRSLCKINHIDGWFTN